MSHRSHRRQLREVNEPTWLRTERAAISIIDISHSGVCYDVLLLQQLKSNCYKNSLFIYDMLETLFKLHTLKYVFGVFVSFFAFYGYNEIL